MKQVIVIRKDLNMRKGKMIAQGAHASMAAILNNMDDPRVKEWLSGAFTKICLSVDSEREMLDIYAAASRVGLLRSMIEDNGQTEFHGVKTLTAIAIGPDHSMYIDEITGHLKLL